MRNARRAGPVAAMIILFILATPSIAEAALSISAPTSANLGSAVTGTVSKTAPLGTVTATSTGIIGISFTATVSCTDFTTGAGTANEKIVKASISYWSGPATATSGLSSSIPGQLTSAQAVTLSTPRTAFSAVGALLSVSASWNPTIIVTIPASAVAGTYTGTVTHSIA